MKVSKLRSGQEVIIRLGKITDAEDFIAFVHCVSGETDHLSFGPHERIFDRGYLLRLSLHGHRNRLRNRPSGF